jgi:hypothetical protein
MNSPRTFRGFVRTARLTLGALSVAVIVPLSAMSAQTVGLRTFNNWAVGCDAARACTALGTQQDDGMGAFVHLARGGGANDSLRTTIGWYTETAAQRTLAFRVITFGPTRRSRVDTLLSVSASTRRTADSTEGDYRLLPLPHPVAQRLLDAAKTASDLVILGATGDTIAVSSLRGLRAALLAIDETQQRIGTVTALARPGSRSPTTIPAAPSLPTVRVVPYRGGGDNAANATLAARLRRRLGAQLGRDCDADDAATFDTVEPLTAKQALVGLHCSRGAYNYWSRWYVVTDRNVQAARAALFLDHPAAKARKDDSYLVNGGYDASTGRFGAFSKGRGLGDCGSFSEWGWDGARFLLIERREYYECRGVSDDWWPVTWRASVQTR